MADTIKACLCIHNIFIKYGDSVEETLLMDENVIQDDSQEDGVIPRGFIGGEEAKLKRNRIKNYLSDTSNY